MSEEVQKQSKYSQNIIFGIVLIGMGVIFLSRNIFDFYLDNWWALFILIPAFFAFSDAYKIYNQHGELTKQARSRIVAGMFPLAVALIFLLNLDWGSVWPVFIILAGIALMFG